MRHPVIFCVTIPPPVETTTLLYDATSANIALSVFKRRSPSSSNISCTFCLVICSINASVSKYRTPKTARVLYRPLLSRSPETDEENGGRLERVRGAWCEEDDADAVDRRRATTSSFSSPLVFFFGALSRVLRPARRRCCRRRRRRRRPPRRGRRVVARPAGRTRNPSSYVVVSKGSSSFF